jgi:hypothetical protein
MPHADSKAKRQKYGNFIYESRCGMETSVATAVD